MGCYHFVQQHRKKRKLLVLVILRLIEFHCHYATGFVKKPFEITFFTFEGATSLSLLRKTYVSVWADEPESPCPENWAQRCADLLPYSPGGFTGFRWARHFTLALCLENINQGD